jgi:enoyl-CoA hydratase/carnithine racemase
MEDRVHLSVENGIADVRLARPAKLNALDPAMFEALAEVGGQLKEHPGLRAVVLSGEGCGFCAGLDVERISAISKGESLLPFTDLTRRTHGPANFVQHVVWQWRELPVPVIAAVHGVAFGGGFQITLGADLRFAEPNTRFSVLESKWGLVPDMAGTHLMRHLAREDVVRELTYTGRIFSAEEARGFGFVTRLVKAPHAAAMATAREIASRSPDAIRAAKRLLNLATWSDAATLLAAETAEQVRLIGSPNQIEAVSAERDGRSPQFAAAAPAPVS